MSQNPSHEETLFAAALALPAAEHAAYLDNACGDNSALRRAVEGLLAAHEAASFMAAPTAGQLAGTVQAAPRPMEAAGTLIGRYKLLQKIGELDELREPKRPAHFAADAHMGDAAGIHGRQYFPITPYIRYERPVV